MDQRLGILEFLLGLLESRIDKLLGEPGLLVEKEFSIHGIIHALKSILLEPCNKNANSRWWCEFHEKVIACAGKALESSVDIVSSASPEGCVSSITEKWENGQNSFSQLVLNQAFHTVKETSGLLSGIIKTSELPKSEGKASVLTYAQIIGASTMIRDMLFKSRVSIRALLFTRVSIEGHLLPYLKISRLPFARFCYRLVSSFSLRYPKPGWRYHYLSY